MGYRKPGAGTCPINGDYTGFSNRPASWRFDNSRRPVMSRKAWEALIFGASARNQKRGMCGKTHERELQLGFPAAYLNRTIQLGFDHEHNRIFYINKFPTLAIEDGGAIAIDLTNHRQRKTAAKHCNKILADFGANLRLDVKSVGSRKRLFVDFQTGKLIELDPDKRHYFPLRLNTGLINPETGLEFKRVYGARMEGYTLEHFFRAGFYGDSYFEHAVSRPKQRAAQAVKPAPSNASVSVSDFV